MRMYVDEDGDSHLEPYDVDLELMDYAPKGHPLFISHPWSAKESVFVYSPPGWFGDWHPTPRRQVNVYLSGCIAITTSDGTRHEFRAGEAMLSEDLHGRGHQTEVVGEETSWQIIVALEDD
jgi:hypothetical protein